MVHRLVLQVFRVEATVYAVDGRQKYEAGRLKPRESSHKEVENEPQIAFGRRAHRERGPATRGAQARRSSPRGPMDRIGLQGIPAAGGSNAARLGWSRCMSSLLPVHETGQES